MPCFFGKERTALDLKEFFRLNPRVAVAFSGGADSSYLLYAAVTYGAEVRAYYVKSAFQPQFELDDALRLAKELAAPMRVIGADVLADARIAANPEDRCYYCKRAVFGAIAAAAREDGFSLLLDGTNASDEEGDRPGMRALRELNVRSPLRECGLVKAEIRRLSGQAGLFTWDKPAYACLATRIPAGEEITPEKLRAVEASESCLFSMGFTNFRVRSVNGTAKLQLPEEQLGKAIECRLALLAELKKYYGAVTLDLEARR